MHWHSVTTESKSTVEAIMEICYPLKKDSRMCAPLLLRRSLLLHHRVKEASLSLPLVDSIKDRLKALYPLNRTALIELGIVPRLFMLVVKNGREEAKGDDESIEDARGAHKHRISEDGEVEVVSDNVLLGLSCERLVVEETSDKEGHDANIDEGSAICGSCFDR
ncbi:hypothetical protein GW17_00017849 [Ensete ventricosum]|nr:hypothetical protein GW17_00017849 [Ensete ventricosum]